MSKDSKTRRFSPAKRREEPPASPPAGTERGRRLVVWALVLVFVVLANAYSAVSPIESRGKYDVNANPDEQIHYLHVQSIASGRLPVFHIGGGDYEAHQPPLYYAVCAPVQLAFRSLGMDGDVFAVRWVSIVLGVILIWVAYLAARDLFPEEPWLAVAAAGMVALIPMNVSLMASISNDSLTDLICALGLWQVGRIALSGEDWLPSGRFTRECLVLGVILGAGIWTKTSTVVLFPSVLVVLIVLTSGRPEIRRPVLIGAGLACGLGLLIGLPWLIRNTVLYGDPVAQHIFVNAFSHTAHTDKMMQTFHLSLPEFLLTWTAVWTFKSFWAYFDSMNLDLPMKAYLLFLAFSLLGLAGDFVWAAQSANSLDRPRRAVLAGYLAMIVFVLAGFIRFNLTFFQGQGRYLYPALIPLALFLVLGLTRLTPARYRYWPVVMLGVILITINALSVPLIAASYATGGNAGGAP